MVLCKASPAVHIKTTSSVSEEGGGSHDNMPVVAFPALLTNQERLLINFKPLVACLARTRPFVQAKSAGRGANTG